MPTLLPDLLPELPDAARVWVYVSDRPLSPSDQTALRDGFARFFETWHTHKVPVRGGAAVLRDRVLVVAGAKIDGDPADLSGCGIDQHVREVERLGRALGVGWLDGLHVAFKRLGTDAPLEVLPRAAFRSALADGTIPPTANVVDAAAASLADVRAGRLLRPLADSPFARWMPAERPKG